MGLRPRQGQVARTLAVTGAPGAIRGPHTFRVTEDLFHRPLRDLRVSVTDRCNFRCVY
ncbi:MAG: GTP 3',8-cyclase MoaA, partial [Chloroflexi bacterium]